MTPAEQARQRAGFSLEEAAQRAHVTAKYLRAIEKRGGASYGLATRLARIYQANATIFLYRPSEKAEANKSQIRSTETMVMNHAKKQPDLLMRSGESK